MWKQGQLVAVDAKGDFTVATRDDEVIGVIENNPAETGEDAIVCINLGLEKQFGGDRVQIAARERRTPPVKAAVSNSRYLHRKASEIRPLDVIVGGFRGVKDRSPTQLPKDVKATVLRVVVDDRAMHLRVRRWDTDQQVNIETNRERLIAVDTTPDEP